MAYKLNLIDENELRPWRKDCKVYQPTQNLQNYVLEISAYNSCTLETVQRSRWQDGKHNLRILEDWSALQ